MSIRRNVCMAALAGMAGMFGVAGVAEASPIIIAQHQGNSDPTDEGWSQNPQDIADLTGITAEGVTNDTDEGFDAWKVADQSSSELIYYQQDLTPQQEQDANSNGWIMRVRLRVLGASDTVDYGVTYFFDDAVGGKRWGMTFGTDAEGDPEVILLPGSGPGRVVADRSNNGITGSGYHLYELAYDAATETASLTIDGGPTATLTGFEGGAVSATTSRVFWGGIANSTTGEANYNLVEFEIVPEPGTLGLSAFSGLFLLSLSRRRGRTA